MKSAVAAMWLVFGVACGKNTSKADVEAFRTAQRAALERLQGLQKEFDSALAELQHGKWVPRPDLGACAASLPIPPSETDRASTFPAFFLDDQDPLGWSGLSQRVFNEPRLAIGARVGLELDDSQDYLRRRICRCHAREGHGDDLRAEGSDCGRQRELDPRAASRVRAISDRKTRRCGAAEAAVASVRITIECRRVIL